jgi:hypothetical protein
VGSPAPNVSAPGTQAICITTRRRKAVWAPRPAHFPAGPGPQAGRDRGHTTAQCRRVLAAYTSDRPEPGLAPSTAQPSLPGADPDPGPRLYRRGLRHWPTKGCAIYWSRGNAVLQCQQVSFKARARPSRDRGGGARRRRLGDLLPDSPGCLQVSILALLRRGNYCPAAGISCLGKFWIEDATSEGRGEIT